MASRSLFALLIASIFSACTSFSAHRGALIKDVPVKFNDAQKKDGPVHDAIKASMWEHYIDPEFFVATIEFNELGHLSHKKETDDLLDRVKQLASDSGATILVFAHGWHHNGDFDDDNQQSLRKVLAELARLQDETFEVGMKRFRKEIGQDIKTRPPLIGISLAWRGNSSDDGFFKWLTFFDRKIVAHHIGGGDAARKLIKQLDDDYRRLNDQGKLTSLTFVGHSFGAALLFSATEATLKDELQAKGIAEVNELHQLDVTQRSKRIPLIRGVGDAIILINPAFEARRYRVFGELTDGGYEFASAQTPKLVVFSSDGDSANRLAFPVGRYVSNAAWIPSWFQWSQRTTALGFYRADQTHWLHLKCAPDYDCADDPKNWGFDAADRAHLARVFAASDEFDVSRDSDYGRFQFDLKDQRRNLEHSPFIVARTSHDLVPRHSDIFKRPFANFIAKFVAELEVRNTRLRAAAYKARVEAQ